MSNLPYFPFYVNDWLGSTTITCLRPEHEGGFIRLLAHSWNKPGCILTDNLEDLSSLSRLDSQALATLLSKAFVKCEGGYYNRKIRAIREEYESHSKRMSEAGQKGAQIKKLMKLQDKEPIARLKPSSSKAGSQAEAKGKPSSSSSPSSSDLESKDTPPQKGAASAPKKKSKKENYVFDGIPDWIDRTSWDGYLEMRKRIRAPLTDWGMHLTVMDLDTLRKQGVDPNRSLDQSAQKSWRGVFRISDGGQANGSKPAAKQPKTFNQLKEDEQRQQLERLGIVDGATGGPGSVLSADDQRQDNHEARGAYLEGQAVEVSCLEAPETR